MSKTVANSISQTHKLHFGLNINIFKCVYEGTSIIFMHLCNSLCIIPRENSNYFKLCLQDTPLPDTLFILKMLSTVSTIL